MPNLIKELHCPFSLERLRPGVLLRRNDGRMSKTKSATPALHKVIMVGSGGVGKSALTLQFMYDEVSFFLSFYLIQYVENKNAFTGAAKREVENRKL